MCYTMRTLLILLILTAMLLSGCGTPATTPTPTPTPTTEPAEMRPDQLVFSLTGSGDEMLGMSTKTTQTFHIDKGEWYIETNCDALDSGGPIVLTISVFPKGQPVGNSSFVAIISQTTPGLETNYVHEAGDFYLSIVAMNIRTWSVKVFQ